MFLGDMKKVKDAFLISGQSSSYFSLDIQPDLELTDVTVCNSKNGCNSYLVFRS